MAQTEEIPAQPKETPGQRTMRQWFQAKLGMNVLQAAQMAEDRKLLRRGARKQQDGLLGTSEQPPENEVGEDMQIRVGDEVHHHVHNDVAPSPPPAEPPTEVPTPTEPEAPPRREGMGTLAKVAMTLGAAALIPGIGIPLAVGWAAAFGAFDKPPAPTVEFTDTDTDTFPSVIIERRGTPQPVEE